MATENSTALVAQEGKRAFSNNLVQSLDHINATNIYSFLKQSGEYQNAKDHLAAYLSGLYKGSANESFHASLAWFEKIGFLSAVKQESHFRRLKIKGNLIEGAVPIVVDLTFAIAQAVAQHIAKKDQFETVVSMLAYVNQKDSILAQARAANFSRHIGRKFDYDNYRATFEKHAGGQVGMIPLSRHFQDDPGKLAAIVLGSCDQDDEKVRQRAGELCVYIGLAEAEADVMMTDIKTNAELFSDVVGFTGFSAIEIFGDLFSNLSHASEAGTYSIEHDPYFPLRQKRKNLVVKTTTTAALASLTLFTGPIGDVVIAASLPAVNSLLTSQANIEDDVTKIFTVAERLGKVRQKYKEQEAKPSNG